jgi:putative inorganic carbon (hco3(-)) transporter
VGWMIPAGALMLAALALTYARSAWLGLAAGVIGLMVLARRAWPVPLLLGGLFLVMATMGPAPVRERIRSFADPHDVTLRDREAMWRSGWAMVGDHPVLGVGPGEVRAWYQLYRRPEAVRPSTGHLHNSAIQIAAERGIPALVIWIWLWVTFFRETLRVWARLPPARPRERALVAASLTGVAAFLVAGLFEHTFGNGVVVMIVYALMALPFTVQRALGADGQRADSPGPGWIHFSSGRGRS